MRSTCLLPSSPYSQSNHSWCNFILWLIADNVHASLRMVSFYQYGILYHKNVQMIPRFISLILLYQSMCTGYSLFKLLELFYIIELMRHENE